MTHCQIARWLLVGLCGAQGIGTIAIDLGRSHARNPEWARHARFHVVWQVMSTVLLASVELALILAPGAFAEPRFYLAAALAGLPMLGFFAAALLLRTYGGAFSDPNGIPPAKVVLFGAVLRIDMNLATEVIAFSILIGIVSVFRY